MSLTNRWKDIMNCYYYNLSSDFLKSDLQHAGFTVNGELQSLENQFAQQELLLTIKEVASSKNVEEPLTTISVDKKGRLIDVV